MDYATLAYETGLDREQFRYILEKFLSQMTTSDNAQALGIYLVRLRQGATYEDIGRRFGRHRTTVSIYCDQVRNALQGQFMDVHLSLCVL